MELMFSMWGDGETDEGQTNTYPNTIIWLISYKCYKCYQKNKRQMVI